MGIPETPQERPREPPHAPETLHGPPTGTPRPSRDPPRTPRPASDPPRELPRTAQGRPGIPQRRPGRLQGAKRAPKEFPETPKSPKMSPQATQKEAKHPRASYPQVFLSVSCCPSAEVCGEGGNTPTRVRSVSRFPSQAFEEGGNTPTRVRSARLPVSLLLSPCSMHPAKNPWMRRSRAASPIKVKSIFLNLTA